MPDANYNAQAQAKHRQGTARKLDRILGEELPEIKQTLREVLAILAERQNGHDRADAR